MAAFDDGWLDLGVRRQAAAAIEDDARGEVGLEALLEIVEQRGLGRGDDDQVAELFRFCRFREQLRRLPDVVDRLTLTTRSGRPQAKFA